MLSSNAANIVTSTTSLPQISVVVPSFQQGDFIEETLLSVLKQTYQCISIWVVDGGSTDNTLEILRRHEDRIHWTSERDDGQADAINRGFARCEGEIFYWLNSDDYISEESFALAVDAFDRYPDVDVIYGNCDYIKAGSLGSWAYPTGEFSIEALLEHNIIAQPSVFFRKRVWIEHNGLDQTLQFALDYDLWLRWALAGVKFKYVPTIKAFYRLHPESKSMKILGQAQDEVVTIFEREIRAGNLSAKLKLHARTAIYGLCLTSYASLDLQRFRTFFRSYVAMGGMPDLRLIRLAACASFGTKTLESLRNIKRYLRG